jgi:hypothetical protein
MILWFLINIEADRAVVNIYYIYMYKILLESFAYSIIKNYSVFKLFFILFNINQIFNLIYFLLSIYVCLVITVSTLTRLISISRRIWSPFFIITIIKLWLIYCRERISSTSSSICIVSIIIIIGMTATTFAILFPYFNLFTDFRLILISLIY